MGLTLGLTLGVIAYVRAALTPQSVLGNADRTLACVIAQAVALICLGARWSARCSRSSSNARESTPESPEPLRGHVRRRDRDPDLFLDRRSLPAPLSGQRFPLLPKLPPPLVPPPPGSQAPAWEPGKWSTWVHGCFGAVTPGQASVRKGQAGNRALLPRLQTGLSAQA